MKVIYQTRFSFYGQSGWRSDASRDPGKLFDPDRLEARFALFERYTLASLAAQGNGDFAHVILSSEQMPAPFRHRLHRLTHDMLGGRAQVIFRPYMKAGHAFRAHIREVWGSERDVVQVVLDDDDALAGDFNAVLRYHAGCIVNNPHRHDKATFVSFPRGLSLELDAAGLPLWLRPRNVAFTNLGLALVGPPGFMRHPYLTSHRKIGERHGHMVIGDKRPYYLRAVHASNDSRAQQDRRHLEGRELAQALSYFPFLDQPLPNREQRRA